MKTASQLFLGFLFAAGSVLLVLSAASLALLEGGVQSIASIPATQTPASSAVPASPQPLIEIVTATQPSTQAAPPSATPTEALHCQNTPADWLPYTVQQGDTITSLGIQSGVSTDEFLKANCFVSASLRLEPGWVVYLPPSVPTATPTMTPTPGLPTTPACGSPAGWVNYVVQPGDTLFRLSIALGISQYELQTANCLSGTLIYAGQVLRVPFIPARPTLIPSTPTRTPTPESSLTPVPPTLTFTPTGTLAAKANQSITFAALPEQVFGSPPFDVNASASSGLPVSFSATGNCTVSGSTVMLTGAGSCSITAAQAGNSSYNAAAPVTQTFSITPASQTIDFNAPVGKTFGDPSFSVSASATSGLPVSFSASGNCSISGTVVSITGAGSCSITASQAGDANYSAAPDVTHTFAIAKASQSMNFGPLPDRSVSESPISVSASASSGLAVSFSASGSCSASGSSITLSGPGSCTVTASQAGDSNYNPVEVSQTFQVN